MIRLFTLFSTLLLITLNSYAQSDFERYNPLTIKMDSIVIKKMVRESCHCFKDAKNIQIPFPDAFRGRAAMGNDSLFKAKEEAARTKAEDAFNCWLGYIKDHKSVFGLDSIPDNLFVVRFNNSSPPAPQLLRVASPAILLYAVRDCPYVFDFFNSLLMQVQEMETRRMAEMRAYEDSLQTVALQRDTMPEKEPEYKVEEPAYETSSYRKRTIGILKRVEIKGYPYLIIEHPDRDIKEEKLIWLDRPSDGQDIIKDFKKYKGKKVRVEAGKQEIYDTKTKQYELFWRVDSIEILE